MTTQINSLNQWKVKNLSKSQQYKDIKSLVEFQTANHTFSSNKPLCKKVFKPKPGRSILCWEKELSYLLWYFALFLFFSSAIEEHWMILTCIPMKRWYNTEEGTAFQEFATYDHQNRRLHRVNEVSSLNLLAGLLLIKRPRRGKDTQNIKAKNCDSVIITE